MAALGTLAACKQEKKPLPVATGRPYEVLVIAPDSLTGKAACQLLGQPAEGLLQEEPEFDTRLRLSDGLRRNDLRARNILLVKVDAERYDSVRLRQVHNVYARPQLLMRLEGPSRKACILALESEACRQRTREQLERHEHDQALEQLRRRHNPKAEALVRQLFGAQMLLPAELTVAKQGKGFLWLSASQEGRVQNICLFTLPATSPRGDSMAYRDSVMKAYVKGETDDMWPVVAEDRSAPQASQGTEAWRRGWWEMRGDAMGGPFTERIVKGPAQTLVADAFVYAPGQRKRNIMRQLEAALHTLKQQ